MRKNAKIVNKKKRKLERHNSWLRQFLFIMFSVRTFFSLCFLFWWKNITSLHVTVIEKVIWRVLAPRIEIEREVIIFSQKFIGRKNTKKLNEIEGFN